MRFIPAWVLLYGFVLGCAMLYMGFATAFGLSDFRLMVFVWSVTLAGAVVLLAGFILLLIPSKFSAGRVLSVIGICLYYVAALGIILATSIYGYRYWETWEIVVFIIATAVCVGLPGFLITRKLNRLQAEYFEY
jgi:hypothetical protein